MNKISLLTLFSAIVFFGAGAFASESVRKVKITQKMKSAKGDCEALLIAGALSDSNAGVLKSKIGDGERNPALAGGLQVWADLISETTMSGYGEYLSLVKAANEMRAAGVLPASKRLKAVQDRIDSLLRENLHRWLPRPVVQYASHVYIDKNGVIRGFQIGGYYEFVDFRKSVDESFFIQHGYDMLDLSGLGLTGRDLRTLSKLQGIERLSLAGVSMTSASLKNILQIESLTHLSVASIGWIERAGAKALAQHGKLRVVDASNSFISDVDVVHLSKSKTIEKLRLKGDYGYGYRSNIYRFVNGLRALARNPVLRVLDLRGGDFENHVFISSFAGNHTLTYLRPILGGRADGPKPFDINAEFDIFRDEGDSSR